MARLTLHNAAAVVMADQPNTTIDMPSDVLPRDVKREEDYDYRPCLLLSERMVERMKASREDWFHRHGFSVQFHTPPPATEMGAALEDATRRAEHMRQWLVTLSVFVGIDTPGKFPLDMLERLLVDKIQAMAGELDVVRQTLKEISEGTPERVPSNPDEDTVRVLRVVEYVGNRRAVEEQIKRSLHGTRVGQGGAYPPGCQITAATINEFPEVLEAARTTNQGALDPAYVHVPGYPGMQPLDEERAMFNDLREHIEATGAEPLAVDRDRKFIDPEHPPTPDPRPSSYSELYGDKLTNAVRPPADEDPDAPKF